MAPEEVHTAVRLGVTVLPDLETLVSGEARAFVRADSLARRPRADAMLTAFDAAAMRKTACGMDVRPQQRHPALLYRHYNSTGLSAPNRSFHYHFVVGGGNHNAPHKHINVYTSFFIINNISNDFILVLLIPMIIHHTPIILNIRVVIGVGVIIK